MTKNNCVNTSNPGFVQVVSTLVSTNTTTSAYIPAFSGFGSLNYLPQQTDGLEIATVTIVPKYSTSKLYVEYFGNGNHDDYPNTCESISCLFRDSGANALACTCNMQGYYYQQYIAYIDTAGSTASTTYKIRFGPNDNGRTSSINGKDSYQYMGGTMFCRLTVYEIGQ